MAQPLISCLMVTKNRTDLARRALACFAAQTWSNKEIVIVDDGDDDYEDVLTPFRATHAVRYVRLSNDGELKLGGLRNRALDEARGEYCIQWDDDEWYHPQRIEQQMLALQQQRLDAVVLRWTLMHLDSADFLEHPYRVQLRRGTPGTVLHRRTRARYPNLPKGEDTVFRRRLAAAGRVGSMGAPHSHLFMRCYHGANTWDVGHFTKRLRWTWRDHLHYLRAKHIKGDLFSHPAFQLTDRERETFHDFLATSRELGLVAPAGLPVADPLARA